MIENEAAAAAMEAPAMAGPGPAIHGAGSPRLSRCVPAPRPRRASISARRRSK